MKKQTGNRLPRRGAGTAGKSQTCPERTCPEQGRRSRGIENLLFLCALLCLGLWGCGPGGYSGKSLFPEDVSSVYVEMFDNRSFWRRIEYELTDALAKRIEAETPYKVISSRDRADTVISGQIVQVTESVLSSERQTGRALESQLQLQAVVNWKNLKTGQLLVDNKSVSASASFSEWQKQGTRYASALAANNLARKIVELMEEQW